MLSDRRPILLANARIVDPSRDLDFPGDLLLADGMARDAKRGIHAAGGPERRRPRGPAIVPVHPMAALTKGCEGRELAEMGLLKAAGAVGFSDGMKSVANAQGMRRVLTYARDFD